MRQRGQAGRGQGHNFHEAEASFFGPRGRVDDLNTAASISRDFIELSGL